MRPTIVPAIALLVGAACAETRSPQGPSGGVACTTQFVYGLAVTVQDKASGEPLCDAEVVAIAGSFRETLQPFGPPESCSYAGAGERPGVYTLRAARPGYGPATVGGVQVAADACHVIPVRVTLELER
jgi:hypothetical protein